MIRHRALGMFLIAAAIVLFGFATSATAATLLFEDTFDDMSHVSTGSLDSGAATWSIATSPDGKAGTSLQGSYPGLEDGSWCHVVHDLGDTVPTSGVVTYQWSFMLSGTFEETRMTLLTNPAAHVDQPLGLVASRSADTLGLWSNMAWAIPCTDGEAWGPVELGKWHTVAMVADLDSATTDENVDVYLAEGLTVTTADYWATCGLNSSAYTSNAWQIYQYANLATGAWDTYIDDMAVYSGDAVVPEPATFALLIGGLLMLLVKRRR